MKQSLTRTVLSIASGLWGVLLLPWLLIAFATLFLATYASLPRMLLIFTWVVTYSLPLTVGGAWVIAWRLYASHRYTTALFAILSPVVHVGAIILTLARL